MRSAFAREFGRQVRAGRRAAGMSQTQLGERFSTTHQTVSRWEDGWCLPGAETVAALSLLFGFSLDELREQAQVAA